jgi:cell wall-associated NlpC family hydrolase
MSELYYADLIGASFEDYGRGPAYDCYGLWIEVRKRLGLPAPDFGSIAIGLTQAIADKLEAHRRLFLQREDREEQPGDLVLIRSDKDPRLCSHIGVVVERGKFLQACDSIGVHRSQLRNPLWKRLVEGVYEYVGG